VWDHCVLAHISSAEKRDAEALRHFEAERSFVLKQREGLDGENDRALRIFNGERFHIFEDFALFLARGGPPPPADLPHALAVSDPGRIGALEELLKLRGLETPDWASKALDVGELAKAAATSHAAIIVFLRGSHEAGTITITGAGARFEALDPLPRIDATGKAF